MEKTAVRSTQTGPVAAAWRDTSLNLMLGKWEMKSTFLDEGGVSHVEKATYELRPDRKLDETQWLEGVYTGKRDDGSPAFNLRFMHHVDPSTHAMTLYEFGNAGPTLFPNQTRTGADKDGTITWHGTLANGAPFVEVWKIEQNKWTFEAKVDVPGGPVIASGSAKRL